MITSQSYDFWKTYGVKLYPSLPTQFLQMVLDGNKNNLFLEQQRKRKREFEQASNWEQKDRKVERETERMR